jgi:hypothetical protein
MESGFPDGQIAHRRRMDSLLQTAYRTLYHGRQRPHREGTLLAKNIIGKLRSMPVRTNAFDSAITLN